MATNVEEIDDEDMATPLSVQQQQIRSSNAAFSFGPPPPPSAAASAAAAPPRHRNYKKKGNHRARFQRQIDTNIVTIPLGKLKDTVDLATGDAEFCTHCHSALSAISVLLDFEGKQVHPIPPPTAVSVTADQDKESESKTMVEKNAPSGVSITEGQQLWTCEFCGTHNVVELEDEEFPTKQILDFLLVPAPAAELRSASNDGSDSSIIFVCDVSGSMCVTQEIQGKVNLKGQPNQPDLSQFVENNGHGGQADQYLPGQNKNVTYVSRLQAMQAALSSQIEMLARVHPTKRVGVVSFASDVVIYGDGTSDPIVVAGDRLQDFEHLLERGTNSVVGTSITETKESLEKKIWDLSESGATALGPAMVVAVAAAAQRAGSSVTLCTDGLANVGLGSLEDIDSSVEAELAADTFYRRIGEYALEKGVTINVVGIEGCGCDVEHLGVMSDVTEGEVEKVAPMDLAKNFASALANPVVATKAQVAMHLHRGLVFRDAEGEGEVDDKSNKPVKDMAADKSVNSDKKSGNSDGNDRDEGPSSSSRLVRDIGNVTEETDTSFEFNARSSSELKSLGCDDVESLPFQVQITYNRLDGSQYVRIITNVQKTTKDIDVANQHADYSVLASHAEQVCSRMAKNGSYAASRGAARTWNQYFASHEASPQQAQVSSAFSANLVQMDDALASTMELEEQSEELRSSSARFSKASMSMFRRKARSKNDGLSSMLSKGSKKSKRSGYMSAMRGPSSKPPAKPPAPPTPLAAVALDAANKVRDLIVESKSGKVAASEIGKLLQVKEAAKANGLKISTWIKNSEECKALGILWGEEYLLHGKSKAGSQYVTLGAGGGGGGVGKGGGKGGGGESKKVDEEPADLEL